MSTLKIIDLTKVNTFHKIYINADHITHFYELQHIEGSRVYTEKNMFFEVIESVETIYNRITMGQYVEFDKYYWYYYKNNASEKYILHINKNTFIEVVVWNDYSFKVNLKENEKSVEIINAINLEHAIQVANEYIEKRYSIDKEKIIRN